MLEYIDHLDREMETVTWNLAPGNDKNLAQGYRKMGVDVQREMEPNYVDYNSSWLCE
jgi:hypothetical protein